MGKFTDIFESVTSEPTGLNVYVWRVPNNEHTRYSFDRRLDVHDGSMMFICKNGEVVGHNFLSSEDPAEPTEESLAIVDKLRAVNGVQFSWTPVFGAMDVETYKIGLFKSAAVPDDHFDRDVIAVLAEHFGVALDDVNVTIKDDRDAVPTICCRRTTTSERVSMSCLRTSSNM